ncbi:MAG: hypothetical protein KF837_31385 [Labilithrix sp.]|nr:hypothetical protein [Labilithrix sp.]
MVTEGPQKPFDRTLHVVMRERTRQRPVELNRAGGFGTVAALVGVMAWSYFGAVVASILVGVGLIFMRIGFGVRPGLVRETVTRPARVRISSEGVAIADEAFVPREEIAQAYHQPRRMGLGTVRALDAAGDVLFDLEAKSEEERKEILLALGRDVTHGRATFSLSSPFFSTPARRVAVILAFPALLAVAVWGHAVPRLIYVVVAAFALLIAALAMRQRVEVGVDGLHLRWLVGSRFVRYDQVRSVATTGVDVVITLAEGPPLRVTPQSPGGPADAALVQDAFVARIEEARAAFEARAGAGDFVARVGRGRRAIGEWRADLARLRDADGGYRDAAARSEDLWRVVEDAGAPEDARAGAAVALRTEEGAAERLRVAADTAASPRLRVALERAADPETDDTILDAALEATSPGER